jgi:hypothetical protein
VYLYDDLRSRYWKGKTSVLQDRAYLSFLCGDVMAREREALRECGLAAWGTDCLEQKPAALLRSRYLGADIPTPVRFGHCRSGPRQRISKQVLCSGACQDTAHSVWKRVTRIPFPLCRNNHSLEFALDTIKAAFWSHQNGNANDGLITEHAHLHLLRSILKSGRNRCHALFDKEMVLDGTAGEFNFVFFPVRSVRSSRIHLRSIDHLCTRGGELLLLFFRRLFGER